MIIDFHTHVFPDKIADRAIGSLARKAGETPRRDGTLTSLLESMRRSGICLSVTLPVVTRPDQFDSINAYAASIAATPGIVSFGGIHPDDADFEDHLDKIRDLGLKGIKLHPDYQQTFIDDEKYIRIIRGATERGLIVSIHAGWDAGYPDTVHCPADRAAKMLDLVGETGKNRIVLAHSGSNRFPDEAIKHLAGREVYFDLGYTLGHDDLAQTARVIRAHGAGHILFATDSPWSDQSGDVARLDMLGLDSNDREAIAWKNAAKILCLTEAQIIERGI